MEREEIGVEASAKVNGKEVLKFDANLFHYLRIKYISRVMEWVCQFTKKTMVMKLFKDFKTIIKVLQLLFSQKYDFDVYLCHSDF